MPLPTTLEQALSYVRRGWKIAPLHTPTPEGCSCGNPHCPSPGKHPRTRNGLKDATTDPRTVTRWWTQYPDANIAIVTGQESGLLVLDLDADAGGYETLAKLESQHGPLPTTLTVSTGGGGRHYYFQHAADLGNSAGRLGPGLDTRGKGGYVVAPPSLHVTGARYEWETAPC